MKTKPKTGSKTKQPHEKDCQTHTDCHAKVAKDAYYKAEKRGFGSGHEQEDWFAAERDVTKTPNKSK